MQQKQRILWISVGRRIDATCSRCVSSRTDQIHIYEQRFDAIFDSFTHYFKFVKDIALCALFSHTPNATNVANRKRHKSKVQTRKIEEGKKTSTIRPESAHRDIFFIVCIHSDFILCYFSQHSGRALESHVTYMLCVALDTHNDAYYMRMTLTVNVKYLFSLVSTRWKRYVCVHAKNQHHFGGKRNNDVAKI